MNRHVCARHRLVIVYGIRANCPRNSWFVRIRRE
jgi:hypothetical protein